LNKPKKKYNSFLKTALFLGRFQPFHDGHFYIFKKLLKKNDNVLIGLITRPKDKKNPFSKNKVKSIINKKLSKYSGCYQIIDIGNVHSFNYGRKVGYDIKKISVPKKIEKISSTNIRKSLFK
tara:strand:+ start:643 stop:1008 length:366 start_codon:yes stop_codon:yes gene_type:complete